MQGNITLNITNKDLSNQVPVTLLAGLQNIIPSGKQVGISMSGGSYQSFLREITTSVHCIEGMKLRVSTDKQMENAWTLTFSDSSGNVKSDVFTPISMTSAANANNRIIDFIPVPENFNLDGKNSISTILEPGERVTLELIKCKPGKKKKLGRFARFMQRVLQYRRRKTAAFCGNC